MSIRSRRQFDAGRRLAFRNQDEIRAMVRPSVRVMQHFFATAMPDDHFELTWTFAPASAQASLRPPICWRYTALQS